MTTDSPELRNRDEIERDQLMTPPEACDCFWKEPHSNFDCDYQEQAFKYVQSRDRLAADVGPLLERLEQAERERDEVKRLAAPWSDNRGYWQRVATRLCEARKALVNTGYFSAAQVGDDIAPRITEYANASQQEITELHLRIEGMSAEARLHEDSRDRLVTERNALHAGLSAARERLDQQTAEIERMSGWRRLWRGRYRNLWQVSEQYRAELAAAQARAEEALSVLDCGQTSGERGCCSACNGTGYSGEEATGGQCSDCRATGHAHGPVTPDGIGPFIDCVRRALAGDAARPEGGSE